VTLTPSDDRYCPSKPSGQPAYVAPDSGAIYFDRSPGGSKIENYHYKIDKFYLQTLADSSKIYQNNISFPDDPQRRIVLKLPISQAWVWAFLLCGRAETTILGKTRSLFQRNGHGHRNAYPVKTLGRRTPFPSLRPPFSGRQTRRALL